jgi:signal transduction histidine kinase/integral membrane sensor domain MASE1
VSYYVGANVGFVLRFPPATPSVLWPPNSVLTATLLLAPRRRWWIYLFAAFPAHMASELPAGWPMSLVLALFATNCSEALMAAVCVRRFTDAPARLDTLRSVVVFIAGAVLVAPFVSSFADAAAVARLGGEPYWFVWRTRFFSNLLTELTLVPAILTVATGGRGWIRRASPRRRAEATLLAASLVTVAIVSFAASDVGPGAIPGSPRTPLAFLLPFLLWAAVRFGTRGSSLSLLTTSLVAIWAGTHGRGQFTALPAAESVLALQIFLSVVAIPLICLAALTEERRGAEEALGERLRFEEFLARLSGAFVHLPSHEIDRAIADWLRRLAQLLKLARVVLVRFAADRPGPLASSSEATSASIAIPLVASERVLGWLVFHSDAAERTWPEELVQNLRLIAQVFANALARKDAEDALRASELMKSAILASLSSAVAVLDREGRVIAVNESWTRLMGEPELPAYAGLPMGAHYLGTCRHAARQGLPQSSEVLAGIEEVLDGARRGFAFEYSCPGRNRERWFALSVVPLSRPEGGAVVSHTEVTERKRAEMQAERSRQELAHFTRVSTMGELAASLAHELRQPLTGIMTNAQAARRFLDATPPDLGELREILSDIIADDSRAAEVIQRLRDMLSKGELRRALLDLNDLIRDVTRLLGSDVVIRNVTVTLELDPAPVVVNGDRVQIEQVILNLFVNAMEAMTDVVVGEKTIVMRSEIADGQAVHVAVEDAGTGLRDGTHEHIFEPFYTTKPAGMGMGLSIAKSIIEAHGGSIWATNNPTRGATFHFSLPGTA